MGFLRGFFVVLMLLPCYLYNLSMRCLWNSYWVSMIFWWDYSGISTESKLKSIENQLNMSCSQLKVIWNQIEINWNQLQSNWNQFKINLKFWSNTSFRTPNSNRSSPPSVWGGGYTNQHPTLSSFVFFDRMCLNVEWLDQLQITKNTHDFIRIDVDWCWFFQHIASLEDQMILKTIHHDNVGLLLDQDGGCPPDHHDTGGPLEPSPRTGTGQLQPPKIPKWGGWGGWVCLASPPLDLPRNCGSMFIMFVHIYIYIYMYIYI